MASHVVVIDATARRHTIKTIPNKPLSDVLQEACSKFGVNADQYGLKHNNKPVDLSRTIRLSGLTSGAKLNLVQASRSPSVISIALQLPTSGEATGNLARLTDKFPSDTPIWQILRRFEAGVAGSTSDNHNFTQRATAQTRDGAGSGAGRLCYEMPVVNVMGRELASFVDLQKTLGQLGLNGGSCLLRLNYRATEQPLEEAMTEISQYFKAAGEPTATTDTRGAHGGAVGDFQSKPDPENADIPQGVAGEAVPSVDTPMEDGPESPQPEETPTTLSPTMSETRPTPTTSTPGSTGLSIFSPPSSTAPIAASQTSYDEADYIPSIAHATLHQARLLQASHNKRLPSDAEIEIQQQERATAMAEIKDVVVRIRFPDQSQAQQLFGKDATVDDLYDICRELMVRPNGEEFVIRVAGVRSGMSSLAQGRQRLIADLGWHGRVLVTVVWGNDVGLEVRQAASLKEEYRAKAENLKVEMPAGVVEEEEKKVVEVEKDKGKGREAKMARFLKGLSKK